MKWAMGIAVSIMLLPGMAAAQVVVSEIMFDLESGSDSGREWIEVFNAGASAASLTEWKLFENGSNHSIATHTGGETLLSGAYAVIADNPAKFLEDHAAYSGLLFDSAFSLSNSGETLTMRCCGAEATDKDSVSYSPESGGGGDGKSVQRTSATGAAFSAATPTPGSGSLTASQQQEQDDDQVEEQEENEEEEEPKQSSTPSQQSSYVPPPVPVLFADGGDDRTVIVGADTEFRGRAYNRKQDVVESVRFSWNFGDGTAAEGQSVLHHYEYPGRYLAVLSIAYDNFAYADRFVVTAIPANLAFYIAADGGIAIENHAGTDIDLSRWRIKAYSREFILPERSVLLSGEMLRISQKTIGFTLSTHTELLYPNGLRALTVGEKPATSTSPAVASKTAHAPKTPAVSTTKAKPAAKKTATAQPTASEDEDQPILTVATAEAQTASFGAISFGPLYWWIGIAGFALIVGIAAVVIKRMGSSEWNVIEDTQ